MADNGGKKGISCSCMLGAFGFLVIRFILLRVFSGFNSSSEKSTQSAPAAPAATTAATKSQLEIEMEEKGYVWGNKSLGLIIDKETHSKVSSYLTTITGVIQNVSQKDYSYVQVSFSVYDEAGRKLGDAWGNVAGLKSGESWKYEASYLGSCSTYKLTEVSAYL